MTQNQLHVLPEVGTVSSPPWDISEQMRWSSSGHEVKAFCSLSADRTQMEDPQL